MILIGFGGNLPSQAGAPAATIDAAFALLAGEGVKVVVRSPLYRSAPVPASEQPWFINGVALAESDHEPEALLRLLLQVEQTFGRERLVRNGARTLDLDMLDVDGLVWCSATLTLPHPRMHQRAFVLRPLADLLPDWRHPRTGMTVTQLLAPLASDPAQMVIPVAADEADTALAKAAHIP